MNKKAFTLIELLVVIVILGIILAMLFPAMGTVREGARRAQCANNLRQHGIAWYLYLDDHDERFPGTMGGGSSFGGVKGIFETLPAEERVLNRYLDIDNDNSPNRELFHCPDDISPAFAMSGYNVFDAFGNSYFANGTITASGKLLTAATSPTTKVHLETCSIYTNPGHGGKGYDTESSDGTFSKVMVLFLDGHVAGPYGWDKDFNIGSYPERPVW